MRRMAAGLSIALVPPAVALTLLAIVGGLDALDVPGLPDPGSTTRIALPALQALRDLAAAMTLGLLVLAAFCVPPEDVSQAKVLDGARRHLVQVLRRLNAVVQVALGNPSRASRADRSTCGRYAIGTDPT